MQSVDFEWVVMAIRIQREVGGNLSELLNKVAETIREREYLERQVQDAVGRGPALGVDPRRAAARRSWPTCCWPTRRTSSRCSPTRSGWAMLIVMAVLLTGGIFWMKKLVKVEV